MWKLSSWEFSAFTKVINIHKKFTQLEVKSQCLSPFPISHPEFITILLIVWCVCFHNSYTYTKRFKKKTTWNGIIPCISSAVCFTHNTIYHGHLSVSSLSQVSRWLWYSIARIYHNLLNHSHWQMFRICKRSRVVHQAFLYLCICSHSCKFSLQIGRQQWTWWIKDYEHLSFWERLFSCPHCPGVINDKL